MTIHQAVLLAGDGIGPEVTAAVRRTLAAAGAPVEWIEQAAREGVDALAGRIPLYSGLFIPALTPDELAQAVRISAAAGAAGTVLFEGKMPTEEHWSTFAEEVNSAS